MSINIVNLIEDYEGRCLGEPFGCHVFFIALNHFGIDLDILVTYMGNEVKCCVFS